DRPVGVARPKRRRIERALARHCLGRYWRFARLRHLVLDRPLLQGRHKRALALQPQSGDYRARPGFFDKWGAIGVFFGHFFGPVRAVIPVIAGMYAVPQWQFQLANILSAFIWAAGVIAPTYFGLNYLLS